MLKLQDELLAGVTSATDVEATYSEHPLDLESALHSYVADPEDSKGAGKRPRDEGALGGGGKASKQGCSDTSRAAAAAPAPDLREELDSTDTRVEELQDQYAQLQQDFDLFRAHHTGQMEGQDKKQARTDKESQELVARAERAEGGRDAASRGGGA